LIAEVPSLAKLLANDFSKAVAESRILAPEGINFFEGCLLAFYKFFMFPAPHVHGRGSFDMDFSFWVAKLTAKH